MSGRRAARGFTTVEALLAVAVGVLVLGLAAMLLLWGWRSLTFAEDRMDPREQAQLAMTALCASLRDCWHYALDDDGARIEFVTPRLKGSAWWDRAKQTLVLVPPGAGGKETVLASRVRHFRIVSLRPGCLKLSLELTPASRGRTGSEPPPVRLLQDLFVPAVGLRDPRVPWAPTLEHPSALEPSG